MNFLRSLAAQSLWETNELQIDTEIDIYIITIVNAIHLKLISPFAFINLQVVRTATREKVKNGAKYCNFHTYRSAST